LMVMVPVPSFSGRIAKPAMSFQQISLGRTLRPAG
jgi:hypothetical protein